MGDSPPLTALSERGARPSPWQRFTLLRPHLEDGVPLTRAGAGRRVPAADRPALGPARIAGTAWPGLVRRRAPIAGTRPLPADLHG